MLTLLIKSDPYNYMRLRIARTYAGRKNRRRSHEELYVKLLQRPTKLARTNLSVDRRIFEEFSTQAQNQNKTLFAFANESLSAITKICAEGGSPAGLYSIWRTFSLLKQIDVITLPSDFVDNLISKLYSTDKEGLLKMFRDLGASLVGLLKIAAQDLDKLSELVKDFTIILPVKQFRITKKKEEGNYGEETVEVDIIGAGKKMESTECTFEFVKSILEGYGYVVSKQELTIGTLRIWALKRGWHS
jgi:hypothetical protein